MLINKTILIIIKGILTVKELIIKLKNKDFKFSIKKIIIEQIKEKIEYFLTPQK